MKLIQLNAWGGRLEHSIADFIADEKPDIVCLQEIISFGNSGTGLFITLETIQKKNDLPHVAFGPAFSFNFMRDMARFGNSVLSRFPITSDETVFMYKEHDDNFMWDDEVPNMRNFVHAVIDVDGQPCNVVTLHGFWVPEHKDGNDETLKQMSMVSEFIAKLRGPVILAGDFNLSPDSKSLKQLNQMLVNLSVTHKLKTTRTDLTHKREVCDYIFVSDDVKVKKFHASQQVVSDHQALILEFEL